MNIKELQEQWKDYLATEYLKAASTLSANDLRNENIMLAALVLSYQGKDPLEKAFPVKDTLTFFGKPNMPIGIVGIKVKEGNLTVFVTGQKTKRIEEKWTEAFKDRLGCGFNKVSMEWTT